MTADLEVHAALQDNPGMLREQLRYEQETNLLLIEGIAELEAEDRGWQRTDDASAREFTRDGLQASAARARLNYLANPLIRRAVNVRTFYTWGQGVEIAGRDETVNEVLQAFLDDPINEQVLFGHEARESKDHDLQTDGNLFLALFTSPLTGSVHIRSLPFDEVKEVLTDPEDRERRRFYRREWESTVVDPRTGTSTTQTMKALYPDIGYRPRARPRAYGDVEVRWDSPVLHVRTGGIGGMRFGVSEVYAALPWARAYRGFLEDWAGLAKALSKFAWKGTTKPGKVGALRRALAPQPTPGAPDGQIAQALVSDGATDLTPISKSGATLDADSGRPLAMMVSAACDIPYTILMGDPDIGNLATAKTLDRPTELAMQSRREMWAGVLRRLGGYVIDQAVKAPRGPLRGTVSRPVEDPDREVITLTGDMDRNIEVAWPSILEHDQGELVKAIVTADGTGRVPPEMIARLLLLALEVENVDEVMSGLLDAEGHFLDPRMGAIVRDYTPGQAGGKTVVPSQPPVVPPQPARESLREAAAADVPPQEQYTDFEQVDAGWRTELAALLAAYVVLREEQQSQVVEQVAAGVTAPSALTLASGAVAGAVLASMLRMWRRSSTLAQAETSAQGQAVNAPDPDMILLQQHADVVADLLARAMVSSAAREALRLTGMTPEETAQAVEEHLGSLTDALAVQSFGGALTTAQNAAREAVFGQVTGGAFYAAERLDNATCGPCKQVDGTRYDTVGAAARAYPTGGYIDCLGRERCRGLVVWWAGDSDYPG